MTLSYLDSVEAVVAGVDLSKEDPYGEVRVFPSATLAAESNLDLYWTTGTAIDLKMNFRSMAELGRHAKESLNDSSEMVMVPVVVSDLDLTGLDLKPFGEGFLLIVKAGEPMPGLTFKIKLIVAMMQQLFPSLDAYLWQQSPVADWDYWLYLSECEKAVGGKLIEEIGALEDSLGGGWSFTRPKIFFYLDAMAVFGGLPSIETPGHAHWWFAKIGGDNSTAVNVAERFERKHKTLKLLWKHAGGFLGRGFLGKQWPEWEKFYKKEIVVDHPISPPVQRFLATRLDTPSLPKS